MEKTKAWNFIFLRELFEIISYKVVENWWEISNDEGSRLGIALVIQCLGWQSSADFWEKWVVESQGGEWELRSGTFCL